MENIFPLKFSKMSGTGNDFIIIDHRNTIIPLEQQPDFVERVCRRKFSAGADGVILIENSDNADFRWQFYNADGSVAEMCGNGARCAARFANINGIAAKKMVFETIAGIIEAEICEDDSVRVRLTDPFDFKDDLSISLGGTSHSTTFINTGVPHAVIFVDDRDAPVKEWGAEVRFHELFQPEGTNANFVTRLASDEILVRTYERGVEDETRACGTGAVASAIIASIKTMVSSPVSVVTSGGERLIIEFELNDNCCANNVYLKGPARIIYTGELTAECLL
jgi:diaminopimelate epimerase